MKNNINLKLVFERLVNANNISEEFAKLTTQEKVQVVDCVLFAEERNLFFMKPEEYKKFQENLVSVNQKILNGTHSDSDLILYSMYTARIFAKNRPIDKEVLNRYFAIEAKKGITPSIENAFLLLQYAANFVSDMENVELSIEFLEANCSFRCDPLIPNKIFIGQKYGNYLNPIEYKELNAKGFNKLAIYFVMALLHEFKHLKDSKQIKENNDEISERLFKELVVVGNESKVYAAHHDSFLFERRAHEYSFAYTEHILKHLFKDKTIIWELRRLKKGVESNPKNVDDLIDREYQEIVEKNPGLIEIIETAIENNEFGAR